MLLRVPPLPMIEAAASAFDAWEWCASDVIEHRLPRGSDRIDESDAFGAVDGDNPPELLFVFRDASASIELPRELARLHVPAYAFGDEMALAPWAIDDATDRFFETRARPHDTLWLAAPSLRALVWGLHDWVHFHNHGPFDDPARTELACDLVALAWLRLNRRALALGADTIDRVTRDLVRLSTRRFAEQGGAPPVDIAATFARYRPETRFASEA